eukprot:768111-Hanusia_phi.AAC.6
MIDGSTTEVSRGPLDSLRAFGSAALVSRTLIIRSWPPQSPLTPGSRRSSTQYGTVTSVATAAHDRIVTNHESGPVTSMIWCPAVRVAGIGSPGSGPAGRRAVWNCTVT